ncbi:MAG: hypothetical protein MRERV_39c005 [Mycoplasmataceae bacterium RV_VA103A]|nr:MAG: hypothetical protein MRERV_39c005 [Mycoplasmataceae bacterium RV_VA103A]
MVYIIYFSVLEEHRAIFRGSIWTNARRNKGKRSGHFLTFKGQVLQ